MKRRVVITGLGCISPLGNSVSSSWSSLLQSKCGIVPLSSKEYDELPVKIAATVKPFETNYPETPRHFQMALKAAQEAWFDCGYISGLNNERLGVCVGNGIGNLQYIIDSLKQSLTRVSPFFVPYIITNGPGGWIAKEFGAKALLHSVSTACATGTHAIGDAYRFIQNGDADVIFAGSSESSICPLTISAFSRSRSLTFKYNSDPELASRPFDRDRSGFVVGEGAGILILEELTHALERKAKIYAEIIGYGLSCDAYHITTPAPEGKGAYLSMKNCLLSANLAPKQIDYINAHATSTAIGDELESRAIEELFGLNHKLHISSSKGAIGHLLGAAGSVEMVFTTMAIANSWIPPTINLQNCDLPLNYTPLKAVKKSISIALKNSFGFYGTNATVAIRKWTE